MSPYEYDWEADCIPYPDTKEYDHYILRTTAEVLMNMETE